MTLALVVRAARGTSVAQRGAPAAGSTLHVGPARAVVLPAAAAIESQRADGTVWRRHWSLADRLVVEFVDLVSAEVIDGTGEVVFGLELDEETEQHMLLDHILPLVLSRKGHLVLHGAVISRGGRGAVLVGVSGAGKSTLTAYAWQNGWTIGGDDGAVVSEGEPSTVEPTYASLRVTPFSAGLVSLEGIATSMVVGKMRVAGEAAEQFQQDPVELRVIAIMRPVSESGQAQFSRLHGVQAHVGLFSATFHADFSASLGLPAITNRLTELVRTTTIGVLDVPRGIDGLRAAEQVLRSALVAADEMPV